MRVKPGAEQVEQLRWIEGARRVLRLVAGGKGHLKGFVDPGLMGSGRSLLPMSGRDGGVLFLDLIGRAARRQMGAEDVRTYRHFRTAVRRRRMAYRLAAMRCLKNGQSHQQRSGLRSLSCVPGAASAK